MTFFSLKREDLLGSASLLLISLCKKIGKGFEQRKEESFNSRDSAQKAQNRV
jgi:hypothetical protein